MRYTLTVKTQPVSEPVTLTEAKSHLNVTDSIDDTLITAFIKAAREQAEIMTSRALLPQTFTMVLDYFPYDNSLCCNEDQLERRLIQLGGAGPIRIPRAPLIGVDSIKYLDTSGTLQTLDPTLYAIDSQGDDEPVRVLPAYSKVWPATRVYPNAVTVQFQAGYANAAAVPEMIKLAIKQTLADWYENREATVLGAHLAPATLPNAAKAILWPFRLF